MALSLRHEIGLVPAINTKDLKELARHGDESMHLTTISGFAIGPRTTEVIALADIVSIVNELGLDTVCWSGPFGAPSHYSEERSPLITPAFIEEISGTGVKGVLGFLDHTDPEGVVRMAHDADIEVIFAGSHADSYNSAYENLGIRSFLMGYNPRHIDYLARRIPEVESGGVTIWTAMIPTVDGGISVPERIWWIPRIQVIMPAEFVASNGERLKRLQDQLAAR